MKVIAKTDEYTIYQKRSERYAVKNAAKAWVNGDEKVNILLEHKLIDVAAPKAPEPEETAEDTAEAAEEAEETEAAEEESDAGEEESS